MYFYIKYKIVKEILKEILKKKYVKTNNSRSS